MIDNKNIKKLDDSELDEVTDGWGSLGLTDYWVQPGETFQGIAYAHHITSIELGNINGIPFSCCITEGQHLYVPQA